MSQAITAEAVRPDVQSGKYSIIPFGLSVRRLEPVTVKALAALVRSSRVEDDRRITDASNPALAKLIGRTDPETIRRPIHILAEIGAITVEQSTGGHRVITIHARAEGIGERWVNLDDEDPAWGLSPRGFKVYLGIRKFAGKRRVCWPTTETLAEFLCTSTDSVKRGLNELRKCLAVRMTTGSFDPRRQSRQRFIHLAPADHWAVSRPPAPEPDPAPDPESAPLKTSMVQKTGWVDRPEQVESSRKTAPYPPGFLHHTHPVFCPIEFKSEEKSEKKPEPPLLPEFTGQAESEPGTGGGGGSGNASPPPPATEPKTDPTEELIRRLDDEFKKSPLNPIQRAEFKRALRTLAKSHGPIPASWVEAALAIKPSEGIRDYGNLAISNLRKWVDLSAADRAEVPDETAAEAANRKSKERHVYWAEMDYEEKLRELKVDRAKAADVRESWEKYNATLAAAGQPAVMLDNAVLHAEKMDAESARAEARRRNEDTLQHYESGIEKTKRRLGLYGMGDIACEPETFERARDAIKGVSLDMGPEEYEAALKEIFIEALPFGEELKKREQAENLRVLAEQRKRDRIESQRVEIEKEIRETVNRRISAWSDIRQKDLKEKGCDADTVRQRIRDEWPVEKERIEAEVRAEFAPKFAALAPTRKSPTPPPGQPAIPAMVPR